MSIIETLLVYAGIPAVVLGTVAVLVLGGSRRAVPRYRPGRPFPVAPVWFLTAAHSPTQHLLPRTERPQVTAARESERTTVGGLPVPELTAPADERGAKGGARGSW